MQKNNSIFPDIRIIKRLPANHYGQDYVIGDLHGSKGLLDTMLSHIKFNPDTDRLFAVGDLIDRGHDSYGCLDYLKEPWFHSVMGNHEELLLGAFYSRFHPLDERPKFFYGDEETFIINGGFWVIDQIELPSTDFIDHLCNIARLPQIITVGEDDNRFNIVHAELPSKWTDKDIDRLPEKISIHHPKAQRLTQLRWSRRLMNSLKDGGVQKPIQKDSLSPTYVGHTIGKSIRRAKSHICLDTGAFLSDNNPLYGLTMMNINTGVDMRHAISNPIHMKNHAQESLYQHGIRTTLTH